MRHVLLAATLAGCGLYSGDDGAMPGGDRASATVVNVSGVNECAPAVEQHACPPWWLSCSNLQLRQAECRTACTTGERVCAGYDAGECFNDCVAYRYEAYCPAS